MSPDPITLCAAGITTVVAGAALFARALLWREEDGWQAPLLAGLSLGGLGAGLVAARADAWLAASALALAAAALLVAALRCGVAARLARPLAQAALLLLAGFGVLWVGLHQIDR